MTKLLAALALTTALAAPASAAVVFYASEAAFVAATGAQPISLDGLVAADATATVPNGAAIGPSTVTATGGSLSAIGEDVVVRYGTSFLRLGGLGATLDFDLAPSVTAFGFFLGGAGSTFSTGICVNGDDCRFAFLPTTGARFFGFASDEALARVTLTSGTTALDISGLRAVAPAPVEAPEPAALALLGLGALSLAAARRAF